MYKLKRVEKDAGKAGTLEGDPNNAQSRRKLFLKKVINLSRSGCTAISERRERSTLFPFPAEGEEVCYINSIILISRIILH
jgi:hypothetical protein